MSLNHIIESWRDEEYRESLDAETRTLLPANPAGELELSDAELVGVDGGFLPPTTTFSYFTLSFTHSTVSITITALIEE